MFWWKETFPLKCIFNWTIKFLNLNLNSGLSSEGVTSWDETGQCCHWRIIPISPFENFAACSLLYVSTMLLLTHRDCRIFIVRAWFWMCTLISSGGCGNPLENCRSHLLVPKHGILSPSKLESRQHWQPSKASWRHICSENTWICWVERLCTHFCWFLSCEYTVLSVCLPVCAIEYVLF
jgi:hypothetical protein